MFKFLKSNNNKKNSSREPQPALEAYFPVRSLKTEDSGKPKPGRTYNSENVIVTSVRRISASSTSLRPKSDEKGIRRPISVIEADSLRKIDKQPNSSKVESQTPEDLSRASSVSNLTSDPKNRGAKPKKSESRDKLDKLEFTKKHEKQKLSKNNNSGDNSPEFLLSDVEVLQKQLAQMANEKTSLALQLGEQTGQLNSLQSEISKLKMMQEDANQKLEMLTDENNILRNRLRDVAHSPLSDNEKQQLLYESRHSSAPASISTNLPDEGDVTSPEWDKHSSSNVSDISVACLQDKINQMQETHYSTNEELQATLQELTDLQRQLLELQQENLRLNDEKTLMFESLCRQTERLNDSRSEVESLKQLLYKDDSGHYESAAEREQKLVDLLKSAQAERETLLLKQEQLTSDLEEARSLNIIHNQDLVQLKNRVKTLESTLDAKHAEHKQLDQQLAIAKDQTSSRQIEISRLKDLLENARTKINELEQDRALSDKSELDELLDNARKEKDALESEVAHLKEQLALSKNETEKFKEQVLILQEECKVVRNNAKTTQSDLEYKIDKLQNEKSSLNEQLGHLQEVVNELQVQSQCQLDDKRQLSAVLSETQRNLNESERKMMSLESELDELKKQKQEQEEEWEKFQNDLLTSVRVANDFKTEAQQDLQKLIIENKAGRERIKQLEAQIEKLRGPSTTATTSTTKQLSQPSATPTTPSPTTRQIKSRKPRLSKEEETLLATLNRRFQEINPDAKDEDLTEEDRMVRKLKQIYDEEFPKKKPFAKKPKVTNSENLPIRPTSFQVEDLSSRRPKVSLSRQNSRQSVKSLIESIENAGKPISKTVSLNSVSRSSSTSSVNSLTSDLKSPGSPLTPGSPLRTPDWSESIGKTPLKEQQPNKINRDWGNGGKGDGKQKGEDGYREAILQKGIDFTRKNSYSDLCDRKDPLNGLVKNGGSKRNALLKWCQNKTVGYRNIDITNFSSSWNDGLALCALLHTYLPDRIPYDSLTSQEKRRNFSLAFSAAESVGIPTTLNINDMIQLERPDWQQVMSYVTAIYKHFEI